MVKVISLPYIFQVSYVLCFTRPRYQVSVYRVIGPLVIILCFGGVIALWAACRQYSRNSGIFATHLGRVS